MTQAACSKCSGPRRCWRHCEWCTTQDVTCPVHVADADRDAEMRSRLESAYRIQRLRLLGLIDGEYTPDPSVKQIAGNALLTGDWARLRPMLARTVDASPRWAAARVTTDLDLRRTFFAESSIVRDDDARVDGASEFVAYVEAASVLVVRIGIHPLRNPAVVELVEAALGARSSNEQQTILATEPHQPWGPQHKLHSKTIVELLKIRNFKFITV